MGIFLEMYEYVKSLIGVLPLEFEFLYVFCFIFFLIIILFLIALPFYGMYKVWS